MKSKTRPSKMRSGVGEMAQQDEIIKDEVWSWRNGSAVESLALAVAEQLS